LKRKKKKKRLTTSIAYVAGVRRGGKGEKRASEAREGSALYRSVLYPPRSF